MHWVCYNTIRQKKVFIAETKKWWKSLPECRRTDTKNGAATFSMTTVSRTTLSIHAFWLTTSSTHALRKMAYNTILAQLSQNLTLFSIQFHNSGCRLFGVSRFLLCWVSLYWMPLYCVSQRQKFLGTFLKQKHFIPKNIFKLRNNIHKKF
jgi:hypothetical protein